MTLRLALLLLLLGTAPGCCLTLNMWDSASVSPRPTALDAATYDDARGLAVRLTYSNGDERSVDFSPVQLLAGKRDWGWTDAHDLGPVAPTLTAPPYSVVLAKRSLWYRSPELAGVVTPPRPVDWTSPAPYFAVVATPVTAVIDIVSVPIEVLWIVLTAGGHGPRWVWWCDYP